MFAPAAVSRTSLNAASGAYRQIGVETGFADAFHLSRAFKQTTGMSPRQFRANQIKFR